MSFESMDDWTFLSYVQNYNFVSTSFGAPVAMSSGMIRQELVTVEKLDAEFFRRVFQNAILMGGDIDLVAINFESSQTVILVVDSGVDLCKSLSWSLVENSEMLMGAVTDHCVLTSVHSS
jgi:hypothetical protein